MNTLIIFTNLTSLARLGTNIETRSDVKQLSREAPVLKFVETSNSFAPTPDGCGEQGLYFVLDTVTDVELKDIIKNSSEPSRIYALKHTLPEDDVVDELNIPDTQIENGQHDPKDRNGDFYPEIVEILLDNEPNKVHRINEVVFPSPGTLGARLELLHKCLIPATAPRPDQINAELSEWHGDYEEFWEARTRGGNVKDEATGEVSEKPIDDPFDDNYIAALTKLRNAMLGS